MMRNEILGPVEPAELARLAASIPVPADACGPARAYVEVVGEGPEHAPNAPCTHRDGFRAYFGLDGGRRREPVGPLFERPREAIRLAQLLNADRIAGGESGSAEASSSRSCTACHDPLPAGSRAHRRTCSVACRQRLTREAGAAERGARESRARGTRSVTPEAVSGRPAQLALDLPPQQEAAPAIGRPGAAVSEVRRARATPTPTV